MKRLIWRGVEEREHGDRHDHLLHLHPEGLEARDLQVGVVDRRQPLQLDREDHDQDQPHEEGRHREADHREQRAELVEPGILPVGRDHPDRDRDQHAEDVGEPDHPERLRQPLHDQVDDRRARLPADHPHPLAVADRPAGQALDDVQRLVHEELLQPLQVADVERLAEAEADADLLAHVGRDGQRQVGGRVAGREVEQREDDEADDEERRDREQEPPDRVSEHRPLRAMRPARAGPGARVRSLDAVPVGRVPELAVPGVDDRRRRAGSTWPRRGRGAPAG